MTYKVYIDEDLQELIPGYIQHRLEDLQQLRTALEARNYKEIEHIGHTMKGHGAGYGFDELTRIGSEIEKSAKAHDFVIIRHLCASLSDYIEKVEIIYHSS